MLDDKPHTSKSYIPSYNVIAPRFESDTTTGSTVVEYSSSTLNLEPSHSTRFIKNRRKTKLCARILMYIGYIIMIVESIDIMTTIFDLMKIGVQRKHKVERGKVDAAMILSHEEIFSKAWLITISLIDVLASVATFYQGFLMVRSTKCVIG